MKMKDWVTDKYWTDALERLHELRAAGKKQFVLDIEKIESVATDGDGPAYKLMNAMVSIERSEAEQWEGYKGAPRVMWSLLLRLEELSNPGLVSKASKKKSSVIPKTPPRYVPNEKLRIEKIPTPDSPWPILERFALTFDGYKHCGSSEACADIANARRQSTLSDLRTCLFFEQRRWRHQSESPDRSSMEYIRELIVQIRNRVQLANELLN